MKIKHTLELTAVDIEPVFNSLVAICLATYPSIEAQNAAIGNSKLQTLAWYQDLINTAFKLGKAVAQIHGDETDMAIYDAVDTTS